MPIDTSADAALFSPTLTIAEVRPADAVLSPDGLTLFAAGTDGHVRVYNAETGKLIADWPVGKQLGGIDLSPDGSFLVVADRQPISETLSPNGWPDDQRVIAAYRVDTATGKVETFSVTVTGISYAFFDVAIMSDRTALVSQSIRPGFSSGNDYPLRLLDLATGDFSTAAQVRQETFLSDASAGTGAFFAEGNTGGDQVGVYAHGDGVVAHGGPDGDGINRGVQAYNAQAGLIAHHAEYHIHIYDETLGYQLDLADEFPDWDFYANVSGLAFDPGGKFLFILDVGKNEIVQLATSDWMIVRSIPIGLDVSSRFGGFHTSGGYGNNLLVGADLRFFDIITDQGLLRVDNPAFGNTITGTAGPDTIRGTEAADTIYGLDGNDRLDGRGAADMMFGGKGHDTYIVNQSGDEAVEQGSSGNDTIESAVSYRLPVHFEKLILTGTFGYDGRGNAGANTIAGNSGGNFLSGGSGNDLIDGGAGNDRILGGPGDDRLTGGSGADRFEFTSRPGAGNVDKILDFSVPADTLYLHRASFAGMGANGALAATAFRAGAAAQDASDRILYDQGTGRIFHDADGSGAAAAVLFATVTPGTALTHADFMIYG